MSRSSLLSTVFLTTFLITGIIYGTFSYPGDVFNASFLDGLISASTAILTTTIAAHVTRLRIIQIENTEDYLYILSSNGEVWRCQQGIKDEWEKLHNIPLDN